MNLTKFRALQCQHKCLTFFLCFFFYNVWIKNMLFVVAIHLMSKQATKINQMNCTQIGFFITEIKGHQSDYLGCRLLLSRYLKLGEMNLITSEDEYHKKCLFNSQSLEEVVILNILLSDLIRQTNYNFTDFCSSCFNCPF